jgi:pSer/pThr/pTyr-binding forkhead associated (FHA) protein
VPHLTLAIVEGQEAGREFEVTATVLIGRDPSADVVIADTEISTRHVSFAPVDGGLAVEDLGSTNGTFVGTVRITQPTTITMGTQVRVGKTILELRK